MRNDRENIIVDLTFQFALKILAFADLLEEKKRYVVARQIIRSGTSIGANVREAQNAESRADFIHKMKIAAKEADETQYWLELCEVSDAYPSDESLLAELESIIKVISKIIVSSRSSVKKSNKTKIHT